ncbi:carbon monoxide dehydrogenase G protein [Hyphomicrobiales bacterium]|nr:carbon monoxide dehydrogenase G protein [Hyphomicrobiales bacterium]CAH1676990.1 carbon monoxide dehydrogenase G protein [Hyphomicrobiales bacterium]
MRFNQAFEVSQPKERVWSFLDDPKLVAKCVPGVESVEEIEPDTFVVRVTQSLGPFSATFEARLQITEKVVGERIALKATGKAVRGAMGNFRAESVVSLHEAAGGTQVRVDSEAVLAGVLGSVGQKVIARQAEKITDEFAANLEHQLSGETERQPAGAADAPQAIGKSASAASVAGNRATSSPKPQIDGPIHAYAVASETGLWIKLAAGAALANLAVTLVILGKLL